MIDIINCHCKTISFVGGLNLTTEHKTLISLHLENILDDSMIAPLLANTTLRKLKLAQNFRFKLLDTLPAVQIDTINTSVRYLKFDPYVSIPSSDRFSIFFYPTKYFSNLNTLKMRILRPEHQEWLSNLGNDQTIRHLYLSQGYRTNFDQIIVEQLKINSRLVRLDIGYYFTDIDDIARRFSDYIDLNRSIQIISVCNNELIINNLKSESNQFVFYKLIKEYEIYFFVTKIKRHRDMKINNFILQLILKNTHPLGIFDKMESFLDRCGVTYDQLEYPRFSLVELSLVSWEWFNTISKMLYYLEFSIESPKVIPTISNNLAQDLVNKNIQYLVSPKSGVEWLETVVDCDLDEISLSNTIDHMKFIEKSVGSYRHTRLQTYQWSDKITKEAWLRVHELSYIGYLSITVIDPDSLAAILNGQTSPYLQRLKLKTNFNSDTEEFTNGVDRLMTAIKKNKTITNLCISDWRQSKRMVQPIKSLKIEKSFSDLLVINNTITKLKLISFVHCNNAFIESLGTCQLNTLKVIVMEGSIFSGLTKSLQSNQSITSLTMQLVRDNDNTLNLTKSLLDLLSTNKNIYELNLTRCSLFKLEKDKEKLIDICKRQDTSLVHLHLDKYLAQIVMPALKLEKHNNLDKRVVIHSQIHS
ncbi:hypothetical protein PPL_09078 [Heterostelium album PN500]|uniref:Uncharacterized protein n=1 Tax=Heterostelium pallidum (strain ATCC 26659 / Pp 5 / PN500) TaxID=670386 RepID=D3BKJ6_HETP5|nr:hypothetical protein PPL_09078 [Heterostelium album PN500]EFA78426.1 hypothetical protein PPL_09078 [Heterostelium album PN500]|eukprot:XP_020430551.1 hypothetical protein PPL_09078 [Heterostelium album PN500]